MSPRGDDPNATSRGERFAPTRARTLVEDESEQFPVASAVPVAPQWGEQRGNTTGTPIGKHNGEKNGKQQRKMKSEKKQKIFRFLILFICFKIMSVHKSKEKKWKSHIFEIVFLKMGTSPKSSIFSPQAWAKTPAPKPQAWAPGSPWEPLGAPWEPLGAPGRLLGAHNGKPTTGGEQRGNEKCHDPRNRLNWSNG